MEIKEAIDTLKNKICDYVIPNYCKDCENKSECLDDCNFILSIYTVLQEIEHLQKENEELKNMDLTTVYINGVEDEKSKILELIDFGVKATNTNDEYSVGMCNGMLYIKSVILDRDIKYKECPKNSISKDKISEKIEYLKLNCGHAFVIDALEDLLKEE